MALGQSTRRAIDIFNNVKTQFGDTSGVQVTDSDLMRWLNDGITDLATRLRYFKGKAMTTTIDGQRDYSLPPDVNAIQLESIHYAGRPLEGISFSQAEEIFQSDDHANGEGSPKFWWEWAGAVSLWPVPTSDTLLEIYYAGVPSAITDSSAFLPFPDRHYESISAFVLSKAYELDEQFDAAQQQYNKYLSRTGEQIDEEYSSQNLTYPFITFVED